MVIEQAGLGSTDREGTPVLSVVNDDGTTPNGTLTDEIVREGARRMPAVAQDAEVNAYIAELTDQRDETARRLVVRNGYHQPRKVTIAAGMAEVEASRVNDKRVDGSKELVALRDGYRESAESWADLMRDCARRGMRAPLLTVGDGALGFWKAFAEVFPATREQRCRVHKTADVLDALPKSAQPGAKKAIQNDVYYAEDWVHPRTTNPIESTFVTVQLRAKVTRGAGSRTAPLAMVFKLVESAKARWRAVNAPHLVALVHAGARFERGELVERSEAVAA